MRLFLDKDYRVDGLAKPSDDPRFAEVEQRLSTKFASTRRLAFVTTNNGSHNGGSEVLWQETALKLRGSGHDVSVLIKNWSPRPDIFDEFERAGIKLHL